MTKEELGKILENHQKSHFVKIGGMSARLEYIFSLTDKKLWTINAKITQHIVTRKTTFKRRIL